MSDLISRADAVAACEAVQAHWASFHSVAPSAAANCVKALKALPSVAEPASPKTCATCRFWDGEHTRAACENPMRHQLISLSTSFETHRDFGCIYHEPYDVPAAPAAPERRETK